jgi:hypothetical protein
MPRHERGSVLLRLSVAERNKLHLKRFILAYGVRGFSPPSAGYELLWACGEAESSWWGAHGGEAHFMVVRKQWEAGRGGDKEWEAKRGRKGGREQGTGSRARQKGLEARCFLPRHAPWTYFLQLDPTSYFPLPPMVPSNYESIRWSIHWWKKSLLDVITSQWLDPSVGDQAFNIPAFLGDFSDLNNTRVPVTEPFWVNHSNFAVLWAS